MAEPKGRTGYFKVFLGGMFSGKTSSLQRELRRERIAKASVLLFTHKKNTRDDSGMVNSHDGSPFPAQAVSGISEVKVAAMRLRRDTEGNVVIGIDEIQFFDAPILATLVRLTKEGINVLVSGLDSDFEGKVWPSVRELLLFPGCRKTFVYAICVVCSKTAQWSKKKAGDLSRRDEAGGAELYDALCNHCSHIYQAADGK